MVSTSAFTSDSYTATTATAKTPTSVRTRFDANYVVSHDAGPITFHLLRYVASKKKQADPRPASAADWGSGKLQGSGAVLHWKDRATLIAVRRHRWCFYCCPPWPRPAVTHGAGVQSFSSSLPQVLPSNRHLPINGPEGRERRPNADEDRWAARSAWERAAEGSPRYNNTPCRSNSHSEQIKPQFSFFSLPVQHKQMPV